MRIVLFTEWFWPEIGGVPVVSAELVTALRERGHEVLVIAENDLGNLPENDDFGGIPVRRFDLISALHARDLEEVGATRRAVSELCLEFKPDVIHAAFSPFGAYYVAEIFGPLGAPILLSLHGPSVDPRCGDRSTVQGRAFATATRIAGCSKAIVDQARHLDPTLEPRCSVIYNSLRERATTAAPGEVPARSIVAVGRMYRQKGFDVLLEAFALISPSVADVRLILIGDGPEREALEKQAASLRIAGTVTFTGWVPPGDVPEYMENAVVVVPSREEGFGLTALEAALQARPTVAARVGGLPEVVADGKTGLLFEPEDPTDLAQKIKTLLDDSGLADRLGEAARLRARDLFLHERYVTEHERIYRRIAQATD